MKEKEEEDEDNNTNLEESELLYINPSRTTIMHSVVGVSEKYIDESALREKKFCRHWYAPLSARRGRGRVGEGGGGGGVGGGRLKRRRTVSTGTTSPT